MCDRVLRFYPGRVFHEAAVGLVVFDRALEIVRQLLVGEVLVVEGRVTAPVHRHFQRVEHAASGRHLHVRIVGVPHHLVAAQQLQKIHQASIP